MIWKKVHPEPFNILMQKRPFLCTPRTYNYRKHACKPYLMQRFRACLKKSIRARSQSLHENVFDHIQVCLPKYKVGAVHPITSYFLEHMLCKLNKVLTVVSYLCKSASVSSWVKEMHRPKTRSAKINKKVCFNRKVNFFLDN